MEEVTDGHLGDRSIDRPQCGSFTWIPVEFAMRLVLARIGTPLIIAWLDTAVCPFGFLHGPLPLAYPLFLIDIQANSSMKFRAARWAARWDAHFAPLAPCPLSAPAGCKWSQSWSVSRFGV